MADFMETARAVAPVIKMLDANKINVSVAIFKDGSGSIIVNREYEVKAATLLRAHGVTLHGYHSARDAADYIRFTLNLDALNNYSETLCPHCGKDTLAAR